ncbi:MAG: LLM class flavin-dependent oxidoreductase, partial [Mycobacterium sp.]|nr:LLM class flavin-dependent oxidoreductase [Mycobacterium sp.]
EMLGLPYDKPAAYTRDYLQVLNAAISGPGDVDVENVSFTVHNPTVLGADTPMPVLVSALGPVMLQLAGAHADGTSLWMADEKAIGEHIAPKINKAAAEAGRPAPRIVAGIPVTLCANSEIESAKDRANRVLAEAETSPNYQRLLDRGEARNVGDLCAAGDEESILKRFKQFADAGVTDLSVRLLPIGDSRDELIASKYRTREVIAELAKQVR